MKAQEPEHFDKILRCSSFVCEASDLGPVRRPRLWWTNAERELREVRGAKWATWDLDGGQAIPRLFAQGRVLLPAEAVAGSRRFHPEVMQGAATLTSLTTLAPTDEGRPAPPGALSALQRGAVEQRWRADGRRLAMALRRPCPHVLLGGPGPVGDPAAGRPRGAAPLPRRVHGQGGRRPPDQRNHGR